MQKEHNENSRNVYLCAVKQALHLLISNTISI